MAESPSMDEPQKRQQDPALYPQVMHRIIDGIGKKWLTAYSYRGRSSDRLRNQTDLPSALIDTNHRRLLNAMLFEEESSSRLTEHDAVLTEALNGYINRQEYGEALRILKDHLGEKRNYRYSDVLERLLTQPAPDEVVIDYCEYIASIGEDEPVHHTIKQLWGSRRFDLATGVIKRTIAPHLQPIFQMTQCVIESNGRTVDRAEALKAMQSLMDGPARQEGEEEARDTSWEDSVVLSHWIDTLSVSEADISLLQEAIEKQGEWKKEGKGRSYLDNRGAEEKILQSLVTAKNFDGALAFAKSTNQGTYVTDKILKTMIEHAVSMEDVELERRGLTLLTESRRKEIEQKREQNRNSADDRYGNAWIHRIDVLEEEAQMHADLAIFEVKHGSPETARMHIDAMIAATEARGVPGKPDCPEAHRKTLRSHRRRLKKELKSRFVTQGAFHALPSTEGWNTPIKDPEVRRQENEVRQATRSQRWSSPRTESDYEAQQAALNASLLSGTETLIATAGPDKAAEALLASVNDYNPGNRWNRAKVIIAAKPELFSELTEKLAASYFKRDVHRSFGESFDWSGIASYYALANKMGILTEEDRKKLWDGIFQSRWTDEGVEEINPNFVVTLVKEMIDHGQVEDAWKQYEELRRMGNGIYRGTAPISASVNRICLAHFVQAVKPENAMSRGIAASLTGGAAPSETDSSDAIGYWNTETELAYAGVDDEWKKEANERLIALCDSPARIRTWTRLLAMGTLRTPHEVKDGLLGVYGKEEATSAMKRRAVYGLIEQKIPGAESLPDFKRADTDERVTALFIRKLVQQEYLDKHATTLLDADPRHLPYLRRLLSEFPNEFNTVMETISKKRAMFEHFSDLDDWEETDLKAFAPEDWEGVLTTLRHLGIFTPGIYAEAKKGQFQPAVLNGIGERVKDLKKALFVNRPLQTTATSELQAEIIYAAYKPANMSFGTLVRLLQQLRDCSDHLARFKIPEDGYALDLRPSQAMKLRKDAAPPAATRFAREFADGMQPLEGEENVKTLRGVVKTLCDIAKLKSPDAVNLQDVAPLFAGQDFATVCIRDVVNARTENELFKGVMNLQELFGVHLTDNLERIVQEFLQRHEGSVSKMIASTAESIRSPKVRETLERQCQTKIDTEVPDIRLIARALSTVILKKVKSLKSLKDSLKQDASLFENEESGAAVLPMPKLRAVISKNVASFFGKASAGICTDADTDLFYREDHFNINIVDEEKQICVGNVQAYIMEHEGEMQLLLRGFNPSTGLLKEVDAGVFCDAVLRVAEQFVAENNLGGILLSEQGGFLALSNRPEAVRYLQTKYAKNAIELEEPFNIARSATIKAAYRVSGSGVVRPANVLSPDDLDGRMRGNSFAA